MSTFLTFTILLEGSWLGCSVTAEVGGCCEKCHELGIRENVEMVP